MSIPCYCGSNLPYTTCCQPKHLGDAPSSTPEQHMRSRYSAFCCENAQYLIQTLHPSKRSSSDNQDIQQTFNSTKWISLQVLEHQQKDNWGSVEFVAFFKRQGKVEQLHEESEFILQNGLWYYLSGQQLPAIKLQRNDPCWCGSGIKLKKCCNQS